MYMSVRDIQIEQELRGLLVEIDCLKEQLHKSEIQANNLKDRLKGKVCFLEDKKGISVNTQSNSVLN